MNLIQIQNQLKSLPSGPQTLQALMSYANGANPAVPPYLALGELNRRKQLIEQEEMDQAGQPPGGTVKDQVEQQAGVMALQQGRQQQVMQNLMKMGSMGMGAPAAPDGIPQPQAQPQAVQAAHGGLMGLLADKAKAKRMNSGGIVALAGGGDPDETESESEENDDGENESADTGITPAEALAEYTASRKLAEQFLNNVKSPAANMETPMQFKERMMRERPTQYGYLKDDPGKGVAERLDVLQAAKKAELDKQRQENKALQPGILQLLGRSALESRGQYGTSALASILGGYEKAQSKEDANAVAEEQGFRAKELEMQQVKMETINKLQELKRARDEGDIAKEHKAKIDLAKLAKDHNTTVGNLIGKVVTSSASMAGRISAADIAAKARERAAARTAARANKPTDMATMTQTHLEALVASGADPNDPATKLAAAQRAARDLSKSAGSVGAETRSAEKANLEFENEVFRRGRELRALQRTDKAAYDKAVEEIRAQITNKYKVRPDADVPFLTAAPASATATAKPAEAPASTATAPAAAPAASAASGTPPASVLKKGVTTTFRNGQSWTLDKNGNPERVK